MRAAARVPRPPASHLADAILAYGARFFGIAQNAVDSAFGRVSPSLPMAARSLGRSQGQVLRAGIWFGRTEGLPERVRLAYRLSLDAFQGQQRVQMVVEFN